MRYRRLPNGFGSVVKLSGKRRYPYNARTPVKQYTINGQPICSSLGCYRTRQEAIDAITEWHRQGGEVFSSDSTTFADTYEYMLGQKELSYNTKKSFRNSFNKLKPLHNIPMKDIKLVHLQKTIDSNTQLSKSSKGVIVRFVKIVFRFALKHEIIDKDSSAFLESKGEESKSNADKFFTLEELKVLKDHIDDDDARLVLTLCYSGFRPSAYQTIEIVDGKYFKGGIKTKHSKDRIVPIKKEIMPLCNVNCTYKALLMAFERVRKRYDLRDLTPHAARHTFKYLCDRSGVDGITCRILMGHSTGKDVHDSVYSHRTTEELEKAIDSLIW